MHPNYVFSLAKSIAKPDHLLQTTVRLSNSGSLFVSCTFYACWRSPFDQIVAHFSDKPCCPVCLYTGVWTVPYHPLESLHIVHHGCPEQCSATLRKQKGEGRQVFHKEEYIYVHIKLVQYIVPYTSICMNNEDMYLHSRHRQGR